MKIFIIGAGATGSVIAKLLAQEKDVEQVICADVNLKRARKFIVPGKKIVFKEIDASKKEQVLAAIDGCTLVVNAASPAFNKILIEAALEMGVNYQDMASWEKGKSEQLAYHNKFKEKNLVGLINASASPGVTNLMAAELASQLKRIEYVKIRLLEDVSSDVPFTPWSKENALKEFSYKPIVWDSGKFLSYNSFSGEEIYNFPEPFMNEKCYLIEQEEVETLPLYIKARRIDVKMGGSEVRSARMFYRLGFMRNKPIKVGGGSVSPYDLFVRVWPDILGVNAMKKLVASGKLKDAYFWAAVELAGIKEGKKDAKKKTLKAVIRFPSESEVSKLYPGANHVSYAAGLTAAIFALQIPKIEQKGAFPPEALDAKTRGELIEKLKEKGVKIEVTEE